MQQIPDAQFVFHNVGQGLFYSGNIDGFEFVYDCGSTRKQHLSNLVLNYKQGLPNGKVDLLVLSHLHEDHVAGLYTLFCRNPKTLIENVILPYLSPIERLILAIAKPNMGNWYYKFLSKPVEFFVERGVRRITYLGGSEQNQKTDVEKSDMRDGEQSKRFMDKLNNSISLKKVILDNEPRLHQFLTGQLQIKSHDGEIIICTNSLYWQFRFFNYSVEPEKLLTFANCIKGFIKHENFGEITTSPQKRTQLRDCYKSLHKKDFNNTSILVLHGPISDRRRFTPIKNRAQLLTGDIDLKQHISEISGHFGSSLSDVSLCLIPHHGSIRNWDKTILRCFSRSCNWVVSTGRRNRSQPCYDILRDIKKQGHDYAICNDNSTVTFSAYRGLHTSTVIS